MTENQSLLLISDVNAKGSPYHDANLFVLSIESNAITLLAGDQLFEVENAHWNKDGKDILSRIDHLVSLGLVDTKKVIINGWITGGHMTNKLISFTHIFVAASSGAGAIE